MLPNGSKGLALLHGETQASAECRRRGLPRQYAEQDVLHALRASQGSEAERVSRSPQQAAAVPAPARPAVLAALELPSLADAMGTWGSDHEEGTKLVSSLLLALSSRTGWRQGRPAGAAWLSSLTLSPRLDRQKPKI